MSQKKKNAQMAIQQYKRQSKMTHLKLKKNGLLTIFRKQGQSKVIKAAVSAKWLLKQWNVIKILSLEQAKQSHLIFGNRVKVSEETVC